MTDQQVQQLAAFVDKHPRLFVLTGAGCSTASGLGDYRDSNGEWKQKQPITGQTFINDELARKRYWARSSVGWPNFNRAEPNRAHHALRSLEENNQLSLLVTQNVDRLHQKAGHRNVIDLHGVLATVSCLKCGHREDRDEYQQRLILSNPWLSNLTAQHAPDGDADLEVEHLETMNVPDCTICNGLLKPDVVFFGENVDKSTVQKSIDALRDSDALLIAGSSLMVYSGFRFCRDAQKRNQPIVIINNGKTRADDFVTLNIQGDCGSLLQALVDG
ncbi:MAG: NAD-dependent SIR2 family protein deacetylase [bacterium]|jgi:NAD-dependent SIR2 family protein deacetylase